MPKHGPKHDLDLQTLEKFGETLRDTAAQLDVALERMREAKVETVAPTHWKSAVAGAKSQMRLVSAVLEELALNQFGVTDSDDED